MVGWCLTDRTFSSYQDENLKIIKKKCIFGESEFQTSCIFSYGR